MAILLQDTSDRIKYYGWYGTCDDCVPFDISLYIDRIAQVTQYRVKEVTDSSERQAIMEVATLTTVFPQMLWDFTHLECGFIYEIEMNLGTGELEIPHFVTTQFQGSDMGLSLIHISEPTRPY